MKPGQVGKDSVLQPETAPAGPSISLLTGGGDWLYAHGLTSALSAKGVRIDVIGSDELDGPEFRSIPGVRFLNLRGDQRRNAGLAEKVSRITKYYLRLIAYAATAKPKIFHILWNNKFETFDRTLLMLYYKLLGKKVAFTAHNVNAGRRDQADSFLNRLTLRIQYRLADHIFVHTPAMRDELHKDFAVPMRKITVIPYGMNLSLPATDLTAKQAKAILKLEARQRTILFFGRITAYKGLEHLVSAFQRLPHDKAEYRLMIVGRVERGADAYWQGIQETIREDVQAGRIQTRLEFIPEKEIEIYFKGADVFALPYTEIFQSGVLFLGATFGMPVIVADVGSLKDEIVEGETGYLCPPANPEKLAQAIQRYFESDLYRNLERRRPAVREYLATRHRWADVAALTVDAYAHLVGEPASATLARRDVSNPSFDAESHT
jgi:glycosyltransferase involved in cell wall biosynthesis